MASNVILLVCLSALAGSGLMLRFTGPGDISLNPDIVCWLKYLALATAVVFFITELFSGVWLLASAALAGVALATYLTWDTTTISHAAVYAWTVAWASVAAWFTYLAGVGRQS